MTEETNILENEKTPENEQEVNIINDNINSSNILSVPVTNENSSNGSVKRGKIGKKQVFAVIVSFLIVILLFFGFLMIRRCIIINHNIKNVITAINNIGSIEATDECKEKIDKAAIKYNALTEKQQNKVTNFATLLEASNTYNDLIYYNKLIDACNLLNEKATNAIDILNEIKSVWWNTIYKKRDEYNNGNYDFDTALDNYWDSSDYLKKSLLLYDDIYKDDNDKTISDYLSELKEPSEKYKSAYEAFTSLYACYSSMITLTKSINHTYSSFSSEISTLSTNYKSQYGKTKALIPEINQ